MTRVFASFHLLLLTWSEKKTCQTSLLRESISSQVVVGTFKHLLEKQRWNDK